jgi:aminoglycoside 6'-N-acetyltransferase I
VTIVVRPVRPSDEPAWIELRHALYGDAREVHEGEVAAFLGGTFRWPWGALLALEQERPVGLVELSIRPGAEGCSTTDVAYLEGWYVRPQARGRGVGRKLLRAAEAWGRARGCRELASDTTPDNETSQRVHLACGFEQVGRVVCFRKPLEPASPGPAPPTPARSPEATQVRRLSTADVAIAGALVERFHASLVSVEHLRGLLDAPRNLLLAALDGDQPVGFLGAHWLDRLRLEHPQLFVYEVEVAEGAHRRGLGRRLMRAALDAAAVLGAEAFVLTQRSNPAALALFRELGGVAEADDDQLLVYPPPASGPR